MTDICRLKIMRKIGISMVSWLFLLVASANAAYGPANAEKGDAIFRQLNVVGFNGYGHTGIYSRWTPSSGDSSSQAANFVVDGMDTIGVHGRTFEQFLDGQAYWGSYRANFTLTAEQRRNMVVVARNQIGATYELTGWPDIKNPGVSFRCDGLVEYVYEQVGVNGGVGFFTDAEEEQYVEVFYPSALMSRMTRDTGVASPTIKIMDSGSEIASGGATNGQNISIEATDTESGSGLAGLKIWLGNPDSGGTLIKSIFADYNISHTYLISELGELPEGQIFVRVYDQAGNWASVDFTIRRPPVIEEFTVSDSPVNGWAGGEIYLSMMAASPDVTVDLYVAETGQAVITDGWITSIAAQDSMDWVQHYDYDLGGFTWSALGMELYRANTSNPDLLPYKAWTQMGWYGEVQGVPLTPRAEPYTLVARVTDPSGKTAEATYPFSFIADDLPPTIHWESWAPADSGIQTSGDVIGDNTPGTAPWLNLGYSTTAPVRFRFDDTDSGVAGVDVYAPNALTGPPVFSAAVYNGQEMLLSDFTLQDDAPGYLMSVKDAAGNTSRMYFNIDRRSPEIHISDLILHQASSLYSVDLKGTVSDATAGIDGSPVIVSISMPATVPLAAMEKPSETWPPGLNSKDFSFAGLQLTPTFGPEGQPTGNAYDSELISVRDRSGLMGRSLVNLSSIHVTDTFSAIPPLLIGSIPPIRLDNVTYDVSEPAAPSDCAWVEKPSGMKIGVRIEPRDPSPSEIIERNNSLGALAGVNIDHSEIPSVQLPYSLPEFTTAGNFTVSPGIYIATPFINFTPYPTPNTNTPSYTCDGGETIQYLSPGSKNLGLQGRADFNVFLAYLQELQPYVDWVPPGNNVKVVSKDLELSFMDVSAGGKVQITENRQYPEIPDYHVAGKHSWEIQVDAAYSSMQLKVCLSTANFSGQQTAEADLYHYNTTSGIWEKITTGRQDNCVVAVSQSASPFAVMVPVDDDVAPRTTGTLNPAGKEAGDKTLYVSTRTYVNYYASDYSIKGDISGVATMYSLIDAEPTEACRDTPYDPAAAPGTCGNPVYKGPFTLGEGVHALYYLSVDKAGNYEEPNNVTLLVDGTPPAAEAFAAGAPVPDDGTAELPETGSVTLAAADPVTSGVASGLAALKYYLDVEPALCGGVAAEPSAPAGTCENPAYAGPFTLAPGTHTVYYTAVDNVGNMAPIRSVSISVNAEAVERASIAPSSGPIGLPFVITGEGFGAYSAGTTVVLIGGATAPLTLWSTDTIRGTVPGGLAAGEYPVAVLRGSEPLAETSSFTVVVPALAGIAPSSGPIGQPFTLTGSGFGNYVAGFTRVLLGGATMPLTLWTDTKIQGAIPGTLPTGDYELLVERALNGGVVRTSTTTFSLRDMEAYWLAPSTGPIGMPFTITGVGFGNYSSVYTHVLIGDTTAPLSLWTDSKIQGTVPGSLVSGQYPVLVERRTADGGLMRTSPMTFEVVNVSVASMTPVAGPIGLPFAIYGTGFGNFSAGYTKVLIGGTTCPLTLWTDIKIQGTIPGSLAAGEHPVVVERTLNGGQVQSLPVAFSVTTPEAYSLSPSSGPIGLPFTITGASFGNYVANYTKVLVGGVAAPVTLWTDTQIKGSIPGSLAAGDHEVVVERALNGGVARTSTFTFTAGTPYLDTISPSTAAVVAPFTITGYNFGNYVANYTKVLINGATTALSLWTDTKIQGKLPFLLAGTYPVQVQRYLNGGLSESATAYINVEEPVISSMTPTSGAVWAVFNLYGAGFGPYDATITKVFVGGVQCALSLWTDTRITGTVPSALSYGTHTVVAMRGQALSNGLEFYLAGGYSPSMMRPGTGPSALEFKLGEVYVYPDPAKGGKVPTFHIEVGTADSVKLKVFTVAGQLAHEATMTGSPQAVGPVYAYEYAWTGHIASGVYYYTVEAERAGKKLKARGRFSVVR